MDAQRRARVKFIDAHPSPGTNTSSNRTIASNSNRKLVRSTAQLGAHGGGGSSSPPPRNTSDGG